MQVENYSLIEDYIINRNNLIKIFVLIDCNTNKVVIKLGEKINFLTAKKLFNDGLKDIYVSNESLYGKFLYKNIKQDEEEFKIGTELNETIIQNLIEKKIFKALFSLGIFS